MDGPTDRRMDRQTDIHVWIQHYDCPFPYLESLHYPCNENLPCSNLCLPNLDFDYYKCACPTGITDRQSCPTGI